MQLWERAEDLYRVLRETPPVVTIDTALLLSRAQCREAKEVSLFFRIQEQRITLFRT